MFFQDCKVLVTGASGLIGGHLVQRLAREGAVVRATVHRRVPPRRVSGVDYLACDLTDREDCRSAVAGMQYVFHCAAHTSGAMAASADPMAHVTPNVIMNAQLLQAAYEAGVDKFLWTSSTTGYPDSPAPMREEEMFTGEPFEKYFCAGWMKRFTEILCQMYGEKLRRRMTTLVLRPTNVYGPHDKFDPERSHVTAALIRKVVERQRPLEVWGTGDDVRDLIYVDDFVEAAVLAMRHLNEHTALNVGLGTSYSVKQVLEQILELECWDEAEVVYDPAKPTMIPVRRVDVSRAEQMLGWRARVDLPEGLRRTIDWYRSTLRPVAKPSLRVEALS